MPSIEVFPAVRGRDIRKWNAEPVYYPFIVQDPEKRKGYDESYLQINYPKTYSYFLRFQDILLTKKSFWKYFSKEEVLLNRSSEKEKKRKRKKVRKFLFIPVQMRLFTLCLTSVKKCFYLTLLFGGEWEIK